MTLAGSEMVRRLLRFFGGLKAQASLGLFKRALDAHPGFVEIDAGPRQGQQLAPAHAGTHRSVREHVEVVIGESSEQCCQVLGLQDLDLVVFDLGRPDDAGHVARQRLGLYAALQRPVEYSPCDDVFAQGQLARIGERACVVLG